MLFQLEQLCIAWHLGNNQNLVKSISPNIRFTKQNQVIKNSKAKYGIKSNYEKTKGHNMRDCGVRKCLEKVKSEGNWNSRHKFPNMFDEFLQDRNCFQS